jgi:hypothetical protein
MVGRIVSGNVSSRRSVEVRFRLKSRRSCRSLEDMCENRDPEAERTLAFERFELLGPSLEEGVPLARVARDRGLPLRTVQRWASQYRREGLAGLARLAHEGTKAYTEAFDLIHRHEETGPNAVWQADHTELDIWLKDGRGQPEKPWLTIILDDYSRAIAGYALSFSDPSAIQTALTLRQAIWRKGRPGWQVCGIPGILCSDHRSDFTSHDIEQVTAELKIRLVNSGVRLAMRFAAINCRASQDSKPGRKAFRWLGWPCDFDGRRE